VNVGAGSIDQFDINAPDAYGRTPLVYTVLADALECSELLLQAGARVRAIFSSTTSQHNHCRLLWNRLIAVGILAKLGFEQPVAERLIYCAPVVCDF
jgi:ankyrin repeat protein